MIVDAYRALDGLSKHSRIDPARIAAMGFSKGVRWLYTSLKRFRYMFETGGLEFAAYLRFYARCGTHFFIG